MGIGLAGLPVFTAGGGPGYVFQPTFGYLLGFIGSAWIIGRLRGGGGLPSLLRLYCVTVVGLFFVYLAGVPWLYMISRFYLGSAHTLWWAVFYGFVTCVGGDLVLSVLIAATARRVLVLTVNTGLLPVYEIKGKEVLP